MRLRKAWFVLAAFLLGCNHSANFLYEQPVYRNDAALTDPGSIEGNITNAVDGTPLPGVIITVHVGVAIGQVIQTVETSSSGSYQVANLQPGDYYLDYNLNGFIPLVGVKATVASDQATVLNEALTTILATGQFRFIVTWCGPTSGCSEGPGGQVRDVDSYLLVPNQDVTKPIGYSQRTFPNAGANLDHDDTQWYGPETITITDINPQGTYIYYVNNFSSRGDFEALGQSQVVIHVYRGNQLLKTYNVPPGIGLTYEVCHVVNGQLVDVESYDTRHHLHTY